LKAREPLGRVADLSILKHWLERHPGIFAWEERGGAFDLVEIYSGKSRRLSPADVDEVWERPNKVEPGQSYVILLLRNGSQRVVSRQGFAFAPSFVNTGPLELPAPVLCMRDHARLSEQLRHVPAARQRDALDLIMTLIALLDGAAAVGLDVDSEARRVDAILARVEKGEPADPTHG
jgi:hypothetical protein